MGVGRPKVTFEEDLAPRRGGLVDDGDAFGQEFIRILPELWLDQNQLFEPKSFLKKPKGENPIYWVIGVGNAEKPG